MAILTDFHIHCNYSGDSPAPMEEMIKQAIKLNMHTICFTDHMDMDFPYTPRSADRIFTLDTDPYIFDYVKNKEKYKDQIKILLGVEIGLQPHIANEITEYVNNYDFDFVIGSSHVCHGMDPYQKEFFEGRPEIDAHREYFESIYENIEQNDDFDVYGHLDYAVRYGPTVNQNYSYEMHKDIIDKILKRLIVDGKGIEVNTSGYKYGLGAPHPTLEIIARYKELGGRILTVGSDGHRPEHLGYAFDQVAKDIKSCGFDEYTVFEKRKPSFIKL
jgi:histidinol-phosphatase (PHP family)